MKPPLDASLAIQALDGSPMIVCGIDRRVSVWTRGVERIYAFSADEAVGQDVHELLSTVFPRPLPEIEAELRATGGWRGELVQRRGDGQPILVASHWSLLRDRNGDPVAIALCNSPQADGEAFRQRELMASIVDSSQDAIIGETLDGTVVTWNRAAEIMFGFAADEMIGRSTSELYPPEDADRNVAILESVRRGERLSEYETVRVRKDGRRIEVLLTVSPIHDPFGEVVGASKIVRDITEQRRLSLRMDELQHELLHVSRVNDMGQMAAAIAHELNQPFTAIGSYLGAVRKLVEVGEVQQALNGSDLALAQLARAGEVLRRLRQFVEKGETRRGEEALSSVIEHAVTLVRIGNVTKEVEIALDLDPDAPTAVFDRIQIQQVLVNLMRNAIEAMGASPAKRLQVSTRRVDPDFVEVQVADTGPGLAADVLEHLFEPFTTTKPTGMGVGLSLCRGIVQGHGGAIRARNLDGGGAAFAFTLPTTGHADGSASG